MKTKNQYKIYYNFVVYMFPDEETGVEFEVADYIFSGTKSVIQKLIEDNKSDLKYAGKMREGFLSERGKKILKNEGVSLDELKNGFMQVSNIYPFLTEY